MGTNLYQGPLIKATGLRQGVEDTFVVMLGLEEVVSLMILDGLVQSAMMLGSNETARLNSRCVGGSTFIWTGDRE